MIEYIISVLALEELELLLW